MGYYDKHNESVNRTDILDKISELTRLFNQYKKMLDDLEKDLEFHLSETGIFGLNQIMDNYQEKTQKFETRLIKAKNLLERFDENETVLYDDLLELTNY